ncbi:class I SAM-dependent methyltransferase [Sediminimonas qiaohouensis]|uniref:class I SAM-dependent methyltransferase n=1 Tax=Sediminimonas qiaohouensis TaxID=552061 RepID=UPI000412F160|nr:class I SAM-dependent methyltransferase [Sediminimonas qiaohouensis]
MNGPACPVCDDAGCRQFGQYDGITYHRCGTCAATFRDPGQLLSPDQEHAQYLLHENAVDDPGYRRFLSRVSDPLLQRVAPGACGLDYGCGPGPALAAMLREAGHQVALYDPFFAPDAAVLSQTYDFVTCTEVVEHFHAPAAEFDRMGAMLRPGGWLAVMTCFQTEDAAFGNWHYRKDPTHVVFYREETLRHIARMRGWHCEIPAKDVALFRVS